MFIGASGRSVAPARRRAASRRRYKTCKEGWVADLRRDACVRRGLRSHWIGISFNGDERIKYFHRVCTCGQVLVSVRERDKLEREQRQHVRIACKCERLQDSCTWQDSIFVAK